MMVLSSMRLAKYLSAIFLRFSFLTMLLVFAINHIPQLVRRSGDETGKGFMVQPFSAQMSGRGK
jgi:hypothetical protein